MKRLFNFSLRTLLPAIALPLALSAQAAGTLTALGSNHQPIRIVDHDVKVTLNNGFARVAVTQRFNNPNDTTLEALYATPVPESAALSEMHIRAGELTLDGEVLPKEEARQAYEDEKKQGKETGLATKESYQRYEFRVSPLPPNQEVTVSFVYYQPLNIDTGVGRFVYPLEDGGTDDKANAFWSRNEKVESSFSVDLTLKSAWPVSDVRAPGLEQLAKPVRVDNDTWTLRVDQPGGTLGKDFVFYYRLDDKLPGRVEVVPYKAAKDKTGTFMLVVTPGIDLKPLAQTGADYVFVLDTSGSMQSKLRTLVRGVGQALGKMRPEDRFRIVEFNSRAREVLDWTTATPDNVRNALTVVEGLQSTGSTDLYGGLHEALSDLDNDRVTSLVLVTDGVTNTGVVDPKDFAKLLAKYDLRVFGFLMGNSGNWPLMRLIADTTGGFYAPVSNDDDIVGQLMLAKSKVLSEALHNVDLKVSGGGTHDIAGRVGRKIYRGQQIVLFGRYDKPGAVDITLKAALSGEDKTYTARAVLPETDTENPELERLWAMARVEDLEQSAMLGLMEATESKTAVRDLGVQYQIVNDETAMVVMRDESFAQRGIERRNKVRMSGEAVAQQQRAVAPVKSYRADTAAPMFSGNTPTLNNSGHSSGGGGHGGGAAGPVELLLMLGVVWLVVRRRHVVLSLKRD